jgi:hypothetical protein
MRDPRTMLLDVDHSGLHSEPGSREWIITRRSLLVACLSDIKNNRTTGRAVYDEIEQHGGWQHLRDLKGKPFRSFDQFCKNPNGLGLERDEIERRLTAQELAQSDEVQPLAKRGRPAKDQNGKGSDTTFSDVGRGAAYLVAKLKRDRPDIAERLAAREFPSARAAAREAGWIKDRDPETEVRRWFRKLHPDQRKRFDEWRSLEE